MEAVAISVFQDIDHELRGLVTGLNGLAELKYFVNDLVGPY